VHTVEETKETESLIVTAKVQNSCLGHTVVMAPIWNAITTFSFTISLLLANLISHMDSIHKDFLDSLMRL